MKKATKNHWEAHVPATNVFWLQARTGAGLAGQGERQLLWRQHAGASNHLACTLGAWL